MLLYTWLVSFASFIWWGSLPPQGEVAMAGISPDCVVALIVTFYCNCTTLQKSPPIALLQTRDYKNMSV